MGRNNLIRKRKILEGMVYSRLIPQLEADATTDDKLMCIIRNFVLQQAKLHDCYDANNNMVALPCVVDATWDNPANEVHVRCLCNYELTEEEKFEWNHEVEVQRGISK